MLDRAVTPIEETAPHEPVFASILCGVNGTAGSREAARQAAVLGGPRAHVTYLAVTYEIGVGATASATLRHVHGEEAAARARQDARELGVEAQALTLHSSSAADALFRRAADHDLLVLGAGAGSRAAGIILGSTATAAVHRAPVPVLLTRRPAGKATFPKSLLVAVDGTPQADRTLQLSIGLARQHSCRLAIVAPEAHGASDRRTIAREAAEVVVATGLEPVVIDARGLAPAAVCKAAEQVSASVIAIGSRGLTGARALSSVSERVAHEARCSVLVVRPSPAPAASTAATYT
jgi:nucleotide-binding universal stress UspA family protein